MLLGVGYSQCNKSNWQEYYPNMAYCYLVGANLTGAYLHGADLEYANLAELDLEGVNLEGVNIFMTNLYMENLCNLTGYPRAIHVNSLKT